MRFAEAIRAVPPSIRSAALGLGASKMQTVFHHVLPLAMPGILTGTIIGLAHALGETAPLLLIGMVAFVADVPATPMDPSHCPCVAGLSAAALPPLSPAPPVPAAARDTAPPPRALSLGPNAAQVRPESRAPPVQS